MATPTSADLEGIYDEIVAKSTVFADVSPDYSREELVGALQSTRNDLRTQIETLPDSAFNAQPADADGNEVWSAGQVISHVSGATYGIVGRSMELVDVENPEPPEALSQFIGDSPLLLSREDSLKALDAGDEAAMAQINSIPEGADLSVASNHDFFGEMSSKSWLMFATVHEADHVGQLQELNDA